MKKWSLVLWFCTSLWAQTDLVINGQSVNLMLSTAAQQSPQLLTSAQPSADDLAKLKGAGVSVIIDLRGAQEDRGFDEANMSAQLGLRYINLPINGGADITYDNATKLDQLLAEQGESVVLLHCHSSNRVGALLALRAKQHGESSEQALAAGKLAGLKSLENIVKTQLDTK